jgi:hypothetical protein
MRPYDGSRTGAAVETSLVLWDENAAAFWGRSGVPAIATAVTFGYRRGGATDYGCVHSGELQGGDASVGDEGEGNGAVQSAPRSGRLRKAVADALEPDTVETAAAPLPKVLEPVQRNADRVGGYLGYVLGPLLVIEVVDRAFRGGYIVLEFFTAIGAFVIGLAMAVSILRTGGQQRMLHVAALEGRPGWRAFQDCFLICAVATAGFASLSALLVVRGVITSDPPLPAVDPASAMFSYYLWHLFDSVPVLDITNTLRWAEPYQFTNRLSSSMLLAYKLLVILPFSQVARMVWRNRKTKDDSGLDEIRRALGGGDG